MDSAKLVVSGFVTLCTMMLAAVPAIAQEQDPNAPPLKCDMGGVPKIYGGTPWLVYGCADNRTVVVVSAPGNPAMPYVFMFSRRGTRYELSGEGTGRKDTTTAALIDLKLMSDREIADLLKETKLH